MLGSIIEVWLQAKEKHTIEILLHGHPLAEGFLGRDQDSDNVIKCVLAESKDYEP
jgi:hypothetical protein